MSLPQYIEDETALDEIMTLPTEPVVELMRPSLSVAVTVVSPKATLETSPPVP